MIYLCGGVLAILFILFLLALCRAAGEMDDRMGLE